MKPRLNYIFSFYDAHSRKRHALASDTFSDLPRVCAYEGFECSFYFKEPRELVNAPGAGRGRSGDSRYKHNGGFRWKYLKSALKDSNIFYPNRYDTGYVDEVCEQESITVENL